MSDGAEHKENREAQPMQRVCSATAILGCSARGLDAHDQKPPTTPSPTKHNRAALLFCETPLPALPSSSVSPTKGFNDAVYWTPAKHYTSTVNIDAEMEALAKATTPLGVDSSATPRPLVAAKINSAQGASPSNGFTDVAYWTPAKHYASSVNIDTEIQKLLEATQ